MDTSDQPVQTMIAEAELQRLIEEASQAKLNAIMRAKYRAQMKWYKEKHPDKYHASARRHAKAYYERNKEERRKKQLEYYYRKKEEKQRLAEVATATTDDADTEDVVEST